MEVKVISPSKKVFEGTDVEALTVPTTTGIVQIMQDHTPLISEISPGDLLIQKTSGDNEKYFISGGYLHVDENKVVVLADNVE